MKCAGRDSCDTVYHDAQSSAGEDTVSEQGSATDAGYERKGDSQSEWLSEIIGKVAAMRVHSELDLHGTPSASPIC